MANVPTLTGADRLSLAYSRSDTLSSRRLGYIQANSSVKSGKYRDGNLEMFDAYYENRQYDGLVPWEQALREENFVPVRERKPRINYNMAKVLVGRVAAKLVGQNVFPSFRVEDDPDTTDYIRAVLQASRLQSRIVEPIRRLLNTGSVLIRYFIEAQTIKMEYYNANHCYPLFNPAGELDSVRIQYVYTDKKDKDENGNFKQKWFRMDLGSFVDVLFDNPEYKANVEPLFTPVANAQHNLGFVQAEWFKTCHRKDSPDGYSLICDILDFIDEFNYNLSQSSQAIGYNQDPQAVLNGMDEEDINKLIRSSTKAWNLGKDGKAEFLESSLTGVTTAEEFRDKVRLHIQDVVRIVMLDPEKIVGNAQSAKAMEILHGPLLELINELRPVIEEPMVRLVQKLGVTLLILNQQGIPGPVGIPQGYKPQSLNILTQWPPVFPLTITDLSDRVKWISSATAGNLVSRETGTRILAKDFGIEDVEEELAKIASQPVLNPFGGAF